ncbi:hypothetical protein Suden_0790 [Sulfurimonas denitrificans DSM 1251]|uniref:N-acetyltransferase domain-containing protein n=1 Tax=Sulfurimonas denitrificans (strain ATCC 33889 / DSM 1251) TaxID=326298 RepID=Q30SG2_SULDN|nr:GNAT family N-acetyltransferase [Sulfurimonas denitrificans]ABB44069.1 hypothetical protein Suden_0790 [Sulfurimonas denitrificans DSM 1251]MDD3441907.1 GNAT family N-acetyltransferase [Sulfurimonas denitrificans]
MQLVTETICQKNRDSFDDFYAIYSLSFPHSEQKSKEELLMMLHSTNYTIFISKIETQVVGFCIIFHSEKSSFYLLEYMAIDGTKRGLGIGSKLFSHVTMQIFSKYGIKPILIEIDSPKERSDEQEQREKREQFYKKLGCRKIDSFDYILAINNNQITPSMELLVYHEDMQNILKSQLQEWLEEIYTLVYGCAKDDKRIDKMLSHAPQILNLI